jgi:hypothetical protein
MAEMMDTLLFLFLNVKCFFEILFEICWDGLEFDIMEKLGDTGQS